MKKFAFLFSLFLAVAGIGFSQIFVGGDINYKHEVKKQESLDYDPGKTNTLSLNPFVGFRLGAFDLGLSFLFETETFSWVEDKDITLGIGVFALYSIVQWDFLSLKGGIEAGYEGITHKTPPDSAYLDSSWRKIQIDLFPRIELRFPQSPWSLYADIGSVYYWYEFNTDDTGDETIIHTFNLSLSGNLALGIAFTF